MARSVIPSEDRTAGRGMVLATLARTAFSAAQTQTVWTPTTGKRVALRYIHLTASGATVLQVKIGSLLISEHDMTANWPIDTLDLPDDVIVYGNNINDLLTVTSSAAVTVGATACGYETD